MGNKQSAAPDAKRSARKRRKARDAAAADVEEAALADEDVLEWQRRVCNDGYYEASDASEVLDYLDMSALSALGKSVGADLALAAQEPVRWKRGQLLGVGAFGRVYLGLNEVNGTLMAAKQIPLLQYETSDTADIIASMEREIRLMSRLSHANIVQYLGSQRDEYLIHSAASSSAAVAASTAPHSPTGAAAGVRTVPSSGGGGGAVKREEYLTIFMEYVPGGSIASLVKRFGRLNETLVRLYTRQVLTGLAYLHAHAVVHRDVKGGNVLVGRAGECKLADFGASKSLADLESTAAARDGPRSLRGTPAFMAPEVIKQTGYGRKSDIWSVGCTVIEMATGKPPWSNYDNPVAAMFAIAISSDVPELPAGFSGAGADFLARCFQRSPGLRPTAAQLLRHPFITGDPFPSLLAQQVATPTQPTVAAGNGRAVGAGKPGRTRGRAKAARAAADDTTTSGVGGASAEGASAAARSAADAAGAVDADVTLELGQLPPPPTTDGGGEDHTARLIGEASSGHSDAAEITKLTPEGQRVGQAALVATAPAVSTALSRSRRLRARASGGETSSVDESDGSAAPRRGSKPSAFSRLWGAAARKNPPPPHRSVSAAAAAPGNNTAGAGAHAAGTTAVAVRFGPPTRVAAGGTGASPSTVSPPRATSVSGERITALPGSPAAALAALDHYEDRLLDHRPASATAYSPQGIAASAPLVSHAQQLNHAGEADEGEFVDAAASASSGSSASGTRRIQAAGGVGGVAAGADAPLLSPPHPRSQSSAPNPYARRRDLAGAFPRGVPLPAERSSSAQGPPATPDAAAAAIADAVGTAAAAATKWMGAVSAVAEMGMSDGLAPPPAIEVVLPFGSIAVAEAATSLEAAAVSGASAVAQPPMSSPLSPSHVRATSAPAVTKAADRIEQPAGPSIRHREPAELLDTVAPSNRRSLALVQPPPGSTGALVQPLVAAAGGAPASALAAFSGSRRSSDLAVFLGPAAGIAPLRHVRPSPAAAASSTAEFPGPASYRALTADVSAEAVSASRAQQQQQQPGALGGASPRARRRASRVASAKHQQQRQFEWLWPTARRASALAASVALVTAVEPALVSGSAAIDLGVPTGRAKAHDMSPLEALAITIRDRATTAADRANAKVHPMPAPLVPTPPAGGGGGGCSPRGGEGGHMGSRERISARAAVTAIAGDGGFDTAAPILLDAAVAHTRRPVSAAAAAWESSTLALARVPLLPSHHADSINRRSVEVSSPGSVGLPEVASPATSSSSQHFYHSMGGSSSGAGGGAGGLGNAALLIDAAFGSALVGGNRPVRSSSVVSGGPSSASSVGLAAIARVLPLPLVNPSRIDALPAATASPSSVYLPASSMLSGANRSARCSAATSPVALLASARASPMLAEAVAPPTPYGAAHSLRTRRAATPAISGLIDAQEEDAAVVVAVSPPRPLSGSAVATQVSLRNPRFGESSSAPVTPVGGIGIHGVRRRLIADGARLVEGAAAGGSGGRGPGSLLSSAAARSPFAQASSGGSEAAALAGKKSMLDDAPVWTATAQLQPQPAAERDAQTQQLLLPLRAAADGSRRVGWIESGSVDATSAQAVEGAAPDAEPASSRHNAAAPRATMKARPASNDNSTPAGASPPQQAAQSKLTTAQWLLSFFLGATRALGGSGDVVTEVVRVVHEGGGGGDAEAAGAAQGSSIAEAREARSSSTEKPAPLVALHNGRRHGSFRSPASASQVSSLQSGAAAAAAASAVATGSVPAVPQPSADAVGILLGEDASLSTDSDSDSNERRSPGDSAVGFAADGGRAWTQWPLALADGRIVRAVSLSGTLSRTGPTRVIVSSRTGGRINSTAQGGANGHDDSAAACPKASPADSGVGKAGVEPICLLAASLQEQSPLDAIPIALQRQPAADDALLLQPILLEEVAPGEACAEPGTPQLDYAATQATVEQMISWKEENAAVRRDPVCTTQPPTLPAQSRDVRQSSSTTISVVLFPSADSRTGIGAEPAPALLALQLPPSPFGKENLPFLEPAPDDAVGSSVSSGTSRPPSPPGDSHADVQPHEVELDRVALGSRGAAGEALRRNLSRNYFALGIERRGSSVLSGSLDGAEGRGGSGGLGRSSLRAPAVADAGSDLRGGGGKEEEEESVVAGAVLWVDAEGSAGTGAPAPPDDADDSSAPPSSRRPSYAGASATAGSDDDAGAGTSLVTAVQRSGGGLGWLLGSAGRVRIAPQASAAALASPAAALPRAAFKTTLVAPIT